jgi:NADPH-dependent glutamate synthase beta subunit-like oxidoreductase
MDPTDTSNPAYFHKVVDCQYACPAHTNIPEYIRMIAQGDYTGSYMLNRASNVFPGILGRTCDRPCEPACRRLRLDGKPVAICRLKRVAADHKDDIKALLPEIPREKNGKKIALVGAGPASLTVCNDLMPLGYACTVFDKLPYAGGLMRSNIPPFRLPADVLDEETGYIIDMGVDVRYETTVDSMKALLEEGYDAVFVGSGAPKGKELQIPGRKEADPSVHIGIEWLESVAFGHRASIGKRVLIIGAGNTAMDCCRTAKRIGGTDVKVMARKPRHLLKASPWELDDAEEEHVDLVLCHSPKAFVIEDGKLTGMSFEELEYTEDAEGKLHSKVVAERFFPCDEVILAIGQENAFPWIERDLGIDFNEWEMPVISRHTMMCSREGIFFGGDAAWGPENIIWAVAHGHEAAISIHQYCQGMPIDQRPEQSMNLKSTKMSLHEWSYANDYNPAMRRVMRHVDMKTRFHALTTEVEMGFTPEQTEVEVHRCLNCDVQTSFSAPLCIECDACIDVCPPKCLTITENAPEEQLRNTLAIPAQNLQQDLFVSERLPQTSRVMLKDEDVCIHCGLCAERCPTAAWDMQKFTLHLPYAGEVKKEAVLTT